MSRVVLSLMLVAVGCTSDRPKTVQALDAIEKPAALLNGALLELAELQPKAAQAVADICRATQPNATEAERIECVTRYRHSPEAMERREELARKVAAAQDELADVFGTLRVLLPQLEREIQELTAVLQEVQR